MAGWAYLCPSDPTNSMFVHYFLLILTCFYSILCHCCRLSSPWMRVWQNLWESEWNTPLCGKTLFYDLVRMSASRRMAYFSHPKTYSWWWKCSVWPNVCVMERFHWFHALNTSFWLQLGPHASQGVLRSIIRALCIGKSICLFSGHWVFNRYIFLQFQMAGTQQQMAKNLNLGTIWHHS